MSGTRLVPNRRLLTYGPTVREFFLKRQLVRYLGRIKAPLIGGTAGGVTACLPEMPQQRPPPAQLVCPPPHGADRLGHHRRARCSSKSSGAALCGAASHYLPSLRSLRFEAGEAGNNLKNTIARTQICRLLQRWARRGCLAHGFKILKSLTCNCQARRQQCTPLPQR